jgi:chromosomal replication initiation ATPase DnaA
VKIADAADLWSQAVERLRAEIGEENADLWLKPAEAVSLDGGVLTLKVPNKFFSDGIKERYQKKLIAVFRDIASPRRRRSRTSLSPISIRATPSRLS